MPAMRQHPAEAFKDLLVLRGVGGVMVKRSKRRKRRCRSSGLALARSKG
jgi:hypothetical protein